jgi:hypothetical protein
MTYPGDDDMVNIEPETDYDVTIEEDYAEYDREWFAEARQNSYGQRDFHDHELWPEMQRDGWEQTAYFEILTKGLTEQYGNAREPTSDAKLYEWIYPNRLTTSLNLPEDQRGWQHNLTNSHQTGSSGYGREMLEKVYPTLGDALEGARERARGKGYQDYGRRQ